MEKIDRAVQRVHYPIASLTGSLSRFFSEHPFSARDGPEDQLLGGDVGLADQITTLATFVGCVGWAQAPEVGK